MYCLKEKTLERLLSLKQKIPLEGKQIYSVLSFFVSYPCFWDSSLAQDDAYLKNEVDNKGAKLFFSI